MFPLRYLHLALFALLSLAAVTATHAAQQSLGEAIKALDGKYLEISETGITDTSPVMIGSSEEGLSPLDQEISLGPLRVTLTYIEEEPGEEQEVAPDALPGAEGTTGEGPDTEPEDASVEDPSLAEIPEEAMLPGEVDIGQRVLRTPVVTVYFDDPNAQAAGGDREPAEEEPDGATPQAEDDQAAVEQGSSEAMSETEAAEAVPAPAGPRVVARLQGESGGFAGPPVSIQIAELDPSNPYPEVVVSFFTGGAHCCSDTSVVTSNADGSEWTVVEVGEFDGSPILAVDADGDGTYEFETRDNAFLYAFGCYACSEAPLQVLALGGGKIKDVSTAARFKKAHAAWLKNMIMGVPDEDVNGFLAGYVGQKIRLGEGKQAWDLMLKYYDRDTDWGLEACEEEVDENGDCPVEPTKLTFPKALERMLNENGYKIGG
jgi:hypothetical protein